MEPTDRVNLSYLQKVQLGTALATLVESTDLGAFASLTTNVNPLFPISSGITEGWVDEIGRKIEEHFQEFMPGLGSLLDPCYQVFTELASNAVEHSQTSRVWALAQHYRGKNPRIEIAICDLGIGIRKALTSNPTHRARAIDDQVAIRMAFRDGVSSTGRASRGYGLGNVKGNVTSIPDRRLHVRSGQGSVTVYSDGRLRTAKIPRMHGTLATVTIPCDN